MYEELGKQIGALVMEKQAAYGDSFNESGRVMSVLYPNGIGKEQIDDALCIVRIVDKLFRIATDRDAFGESPYRDIAGYSLLGAVRAERRSLLIRESLRILTAEKKTAARMNNPLFAEKMHQLDTDSVVAFGVKLVSRYGKADEVSQMLDFAIQVASEGVSELIEEVFYDSQACLCTFKFKQELSEQSERIVFNAAMKTILQFEWHSAVHHGGAHGKSE